MAERHRRRPIVFKRSVRVGRQERIRIPQPIDRPLRLKTRNLVKNEFLKDDPWWFTLHRRGVRRPKVGEDPLEARAVSKETVNGTLPERILYLALIHVLHMQPDADFDFQSSLQGGRLELGGIVADFILEYLRMIIRVQGPTHAQFLRQAKDEEQRMALEEMGYLVCDIYDTTIYDEYRLEDWLRRKFGLASTRGGGPAAAPYDQEETTAGGNTQQELIDAIYAEVVRAEDMLDNLQTEIPVLIRNLN